MIYTNLDTDNMFDEIITHLKNITNKDYILSVLKTNLDYGLITKSEYEKLLKLKIQQKEQQAILHLLQVTLEVSSFLLQIIQMF